MHRILDIALICLLGTVMTAIRSTAVARPLGGEGNGGDYVEGMFIREGNSVLNVLRTTPQGTKLVRTFHLNLQDLKDTLDANRIFVKNGPLYDNTGAEVDAVCNSGMLNLNRSRWMFIFNQPANRSRFMVFHEMLRSAGVGDDSYRISIYLDAPLDILPPQPVLPLTGRIDPSRVSIELLSQQTPLNEPRVRIDDSLGALELEIPQVFLKARDPIPARYRFQIPIHVPAGEHIRLSQVQYWLETILTRQQGFRVTTRARYTASQMLEPQTYQIDSTYDGSYLARSPLQVSITTDDIMTFELDMEWIHTSWNIPPSNGGSMTRIFLFFEAVPGNQ